MKIFREYSQSQIFLLPPSLEEFVPEDHEARIIISNAEQNKGILRSKGINWQVLGPMKRG